MGAAVAAALRGHASRARLAMVDQAIGRSSPSPGCLPDRTDAARTCLRPGSAAIENGLGLGTASSTALHPGADAHTVEQDVVLRTGISSRPPIRPGCRPDRRPRPGSAPAWLCSVGRPPRVNASGRRMPDAQLEERWATGTSRTWSTPRGSRPGRAFVDHCDRGQ
ncbi:hypothetical protein HBB16_21180 [Pseudonocardia sp. MCCB 268]|nr:hypothetical protein [Pseudonocardia cytotoxica]